MTDHGERMTAEQYAQEYWGPGHGRVEHLTTVFERAMRDARRAAFEEAAGIAEANHTFSALAADKIAAAIRRRAGEEA